jgi:hypothetical protein
MEELFLASKMLNNVSKILKKNRQLSQASKYSLLRTTTLA